MRLLNTHNYRLESFLDEGSARYAILSHRWREEEVEFADVRNDEFPSSMKGALKIMKCCELAVSQGLDYAWIDTCSIDKSSSAELSEAINSMYRWYENASICYAFLDDVYKDDEKTFRESSWFTRSWTLQELLAPQKIVFYDKHWQEIGTRESQCYIIYNITQISPMILMKKSDARDFSVAQRMSWASRRQASKVEDVAYSLMGLFEVNMPLLYGEGQKAFLRLQKNIIKTSDDQSIFAWSGVQEDYPGLLAPSPHCFSMCHDVIPIQSRKGGNAFMMTNRGLLITLEIYQWNKLDMYVAILNCAREKDIWGRCGYSRVGIFLRRLTEFDQWARVKDDCDDLRDQMDDHKLAWRQANPIFNHQSAAVSEEVRALMTYDGTRNHPFWDWRGYHVREMAIKVRQVPFLDRHAEDALYCRRQRMHGFQIGHKMLKHNSDQKPFYKEVLGRSISDGRQRILRPNPRSEYPQSIVGVIDISRQKTPIKIVSLGFDFEFNPVCFLAEASALEAENSAKKSLIEVIQATEERQQFDTHDVGDKKLVDLHTSHAYFDCDRINALKGILERLPTDTVGWNQMDQGIALPHKFRKGLWALKGDYVHGLRVKLKDLGFQVKMQSFFADPVVWRFELKRVKDFVYDERVKESRRGGTV